MLKEPTIEKLQAMRLDAMAAAWNEQQGKPDIANLSFDERLGMLVDAEWLHRENKRLKTVLREAKLKLSSACLEDIEYAAKREIDRAQIRQLATCRWVAEHHNLLITGMTGTGKTYIACAFAQQACRKGYRAIYRRASRLFSELALARADGSYSRLLAKLARADVLVLDDWAIAPITDTERRDLLEVLEDRYGTRSTIVTSQLSPKRWYEHIADPTHADAICDRLIHNAHKLVLKGPSKRKPEEQENDK
jgi:DNA replication protein DnaC